MTNTPDTWDHERILNGLLSCVYCKSPMIKVGLNYICQAQVINPQVPCQTPRINAYELLQLTVNHIINRTINDQTTEQLKGHHPRTNTLRRPNAPRMIWTKPRMPSRH